MAYCHGNIVDRDSWQCACKFNIHVYLYSWRNVRSFFHCW